MCLQETRWSDSTATSFLQNYPGYNLVHTSALVTDQGGLSGGTAILIPCSFRLSREVVIAPGRIVAAHIQSRADSCWVVSVYCHPTTAGQDLETLTSWITDHQNESDPFFILGDFNHGHTFLHQMHGSSSLSCHKSRTLLTTNPHIGDLMARPLLTKYYCPLTFLTEALFNTTLFMIAILKTRAMPV